MAVLIADVLSEIEGGIGRERCAHIGGDQDGEPARIAGRHRSGDAIGDPQEQGALRREHQRQERKQPERDAPIQAAMPLAAFSRHRRTCSRRPTP